MSHTREAKERVKQILNFHPIYEELIVAKKKSTTLRFGDQREMYSVGDVIDISVGWDASKNKVRKISRGRITYVDSKLINSITEEDVKGESPDCLNIPAIKYVLGSIYKSVLHEDDTITIIKWDFI
jgi:hypothetical protein